jgi:hypothetical protein
VVGALDVVGACGVVGALDVAGACGMVGVPDVVEALDVVGAGDVVRIRCSTMNSSSTEARLPPPLFQSHPWLSSKTTSRETRTC